jgi:predicted nucleic acid-binding Zn ribbon protein
MPTYEFRLPDGTIIEQRFKISEVPSEIPNPNGEGVATRIISGGAGLLFKGSGFYLTDYGRNAHRTQGDAPKAGAESSGGGAKSDSTGGSGDGAASKSDSSSERKSDGKSESKSDGGSKPASDAKPASAAKSEPKASGSGPAAA